MSNETMDSCWMDEYDPELQPGLTCHIEMDTVIGKTSREVAAITARTLRALAAQIEAGVLDDGFHPINVPSGEEIGEVYLDWYAQSQDL